MEYGVLLLRLQPAAKMTVRFWRASCRRRSGQYGPFFQNALLNIGANTGALTANIPTAVSRKPHRLIVITEGVPEMVKAARMIAVEIRKSPEQRSKETPNRRICETRICHRMGTGTQRMARSVSTFRTTRVQKFCGRKVQRSGGRGRTAQFSWMLVMRLVYSLGVG